MSQRLLLLTVLLLCQACAVQQPQLACSPQPIYQTTDHFSDIESAALALTSRFGADKVLLVFDIDSTLLTMNQDLGSDPWFHWQSDLLKADPDHSSLIANTFSELLETQGLLYSVSGMSPVETDQPGLLKRLQQLGLRKILLTSRGPEMHDATLRELQNNGYVLNPSFAANTGRYYPYDLSSLKKQNLDNQALQKFRLLSEACTDPQTCLQPARLTSFENGLYMTSGQHKGLMLKLLLDSSEQHKFKAILFIDDTQKHVRDMYNTFCSTSMQLKLFHYTHEETRIKQFQQQDKDYLIERWQRLQQAIQPLQ